jgi:hypothetical protein
MRLVACGIFKREFSLLDAGLRDRFEPIFLDSMLHMRPEALDETLKNICGRIEGETALLFGDCCPHMRELREGSSCPRPLGVNCVEIAIGALRYRELRRARSFFFMPEWVHRWKEIFEFELGLRDGDLARAFMQEEMGQLVYIDTGAIPVPEEELARIREYFGLPLTVEKAGTGGLAATLEALLPGAGAGKSHEL